MRKSKNNVIDLSKKNPDEIHEFLQALLDVRYKLNKNGLNVNIKRLSRIKKNRNNRGISHVVKSKRT